MNAFLGLFQRLRPQRVLRCGGRFSAFVLACVPAFAAQDARHPLRELALAEFGVTQCEFVRVELPAATPARIQTRLSLAGREFTLHLRPYSQRTRSFRVLVDDGSGELRSAAAPPVGTYRGGLLEAPGSRASASRVAGRWTIDVRLNPDEQWFLQPLSELGPGADPDEFVAYRVRDVVAGGEQCGGALLGGVQPGVGQPGPSGAPSAAASGLHLTEIAFDADFQFYQLNGHSVANTVADIEAVMNSVNGIFANDAQIVHLFTTILVRTSTNQPYTSSDHLQLLDQFRSEWMNNQAGIARDVAHLMTGRNLNGSTIGVAWYHGICSNNWGFGLSQSRFTSNFAQRVGLTAHELGHNWSACHCNESQSGCASISSTCCQSSSNCRIMCSIIGGCSGNVGSFAPLSVQAIVEFRSAAPCLGSGGRLHVDPSATGFQNGLDWANAFHDLSDALALAQPGDEVWVAAGTYAPGSGSTSRDSTFELPQDAAVYGGFTGSETGLGQRDPSANLTVLSGVLGGGARAYHVVTAVGLGSATVLDGFTIRDGLANGSGLRSVGAGVLIEGGSPCIRDCTLAHNQASYEGGAVYAYFGSAAFFENCVLRDNSAALNGGAVLQRGTPGATFARCTFRTNTARYGGAMYIDQGLCLCSECLFAANTAIDSAGGSSFGGAVVSVVANFFDGPTFAGCTFWGNAATGSGSSLGGGIHANKFGSVGSALTLANCILWGNVHGSTQSSAAQIYAASGATGAYHIDHCCVQGGLGWLVGTANISADPLFVSPLTGDFGLSVGSPCLDAGDDARVPAFASLDLTGAPRFSDGDGDGVIKVDVGAVERQSDCNGNGVADWLDVTQGASWDLNQNGVPDECELLANFYCRCPAPSAPCGNPDPNAGCRNSTGAGGMLNTQGTGSVSKDDLVLTALQLPTDKSGLFFMGWSPIATPLGDGLRCVGGSTARFNPATSTGVAGTLILGPGIVARTQSQFGPLHGITAGSIWHFQCWHRDPQGPCGSGSNLTDALTVTFTP